MRLTWKQVGKAIETFSLLVFFCLTTSVVAEETSKVDRRYEFDIPVQPLARSLNIVSDIANISFLFPYELVENLEVPRDIQGRYTVEQVLNLLLKGSNLEGELSNDRAFLIRPLTDKKDNNKHLGIDKMRSNKNFLAAAIAIIFGSSGVQAQDAATAQADSSFSVVLEEVVVTGVFKGTNQRSVSVAVSTVDEEELSEKIFVSSADILKDIPGVYVNAALGEIRNIVYSRGISANSSDGNNGYFYVNLQEDGLPVHNAIATNFGPDYFHRADIMTRRVEAVRGGSAAITGPNSPGGIFNYISKTGKSNPGTEISTRYGSEGGGSGNPYYRADFYTGGSFTDNIHYALGGFYRDGTGPRDPGYSMNRGGQIRANLVFDYDDGSFQLNYKNLNDHNLWDEFLPVNGIGAKPMNGFDYDSSVNPRRIPRTFSALDSNFAPGTADSKDKWDPAEGIHSTQTSYGFKWDHDMDDGWSLSNNFRMSKSESDWNSGAAIFAMSADYPNIYGNNSWGNGIVAIGENAADGSYTPYDGTISLKNQAGDELASIKAEDGTYTILSSTLPDDPNLPNGILVQTAYAPNPSSKETINQFSLTKELDNMSFTVGSFYGKSDVKWRSGEGGTGLSQFNAGREMLDISITRTDGTVQQVTDPDGFTGEGRIGAFTNFTAYAEQEQVSFFFGHDWTITEQLSLNWGVRHETIDIEGYNQFATQVSDKEGGADDDPNTLYDNQIQTLGAPQRYDVSLDYTSFSGALSYEWNDAQSTYIRFSEGDKAPALSTFMGTGGIEDYQLTPQTITQLELGHRIYGDNYSITLTPFYSELTNIGGFGSASQGKNVDGTTYTRASLLSAQETIGLEIESEYDLSDSLSLNWNATVQSSESTDNSYWDYGTANNAATGFDDDKVVSLSDGAAPNTPNFTSALTGNYTLDDWKLFATWRYMGERPISTQDQLQFEAFHTIDVGVNWTPNENWSVNLNVNNLLNEHGVMSWQGIGDFGALSRATDPKAGPTGDLRWSVVQQQPRLIFLTAKYKFN